MKVNYLEELAMTNKLSTSSGDDVLHQFLLYWLKNRDFSPPVDDVVTHFHGKASGSVLYRKGSFQVQLFTVAPNVEIPDHIHPNMDSYEVHVGGDIAFRLNGSYELEQMPGLAGVTRVLPNAFHGGSFGKRGGLFLSVQHWLNGVAPSSAGEDLTFLEPSETEVSYFDDMAGARYEQCVDRQLVKHFSANS